MEALITYRGSEYFDPQKLCTVTGLDRSQWHHGIFKELLDNALDAIDAKPDKHIDIALTETALTIQDSGDGIRPDDLAKIYDFNVYLSSKRDRCLPSRGSQGNALKTIIGITACNQYTLAFHSHGQEFRYDLDRNYFDATQQPKFNKHISSNGHIPSGVFVDFNAPTPYKFDDLQNKIFNYALCNPDVSFSLKTPENTLSFPAVAAPMVRGDASFIAWYTFEAFNTLLQKSAEKTPDKTIKAFCEEEFSGTQRILAKLTITHKYLHEIRGDREAIQSLYRQLQDLTKRPTPKFLSKYASGKPAFLQRTGAGEHAKYKTLFNEITFQGATIPYCLEAFYYPAPGGFQYFVSINNSIPYHRNAFRAKASTPYTFLGEPVEQWYYSPIDLDTVLKQERIFNIVDRTLLLNFVCPVKGFGVTDQSKNYIIADAFFQPMLDVIGDVMDKDVKTLRQTRKKAQAAEDAARKKLAEEHKHQEQAAKAEYKELKKQLPTAIGALTDNFDWALQQDESENNLTSMPRHLFYVIRDHVNKLYQELMAKVGKDIFGTSAYDTFTQKVITQKFQENPQLQKRILFAPRGFLYDYTTNEVRYLGSKEAIEIQEHHYPTHADLPETIHPKWRFNSALFVEKSTIFETLKSSGLPSELNFLLICSQGFSTRAIKEVLSFYDDHHMPIYLLSDCDITGYHIAYTMQNPTDTFDVGLNAKRIGLTVDQVIKLGLQFEPYVNERKDSTPIEYKKVLEHLTPFEYNHLVIDKAEGKYQRLEIDTLSNQQLFTILREAITPRPLLPDHKTLFHAFGYVESPQNMVERIFKDEITNAILKEFYDDFAQGILPEKALKRHTVRMIQEHAAMPEFNKKHNAAWLTYGNNARFKFGRHAARTVRRNIRAVFKNKRKFAQIVKIISDSLQNEN